MQCEFGDEGNKRNKTSSMSDMPKKNNDQQESGKYSEQTATTPLRKEWYAVIVYMKYQWRDSKFSTEN